jgi:hypothetical protein
MGLKVDQLVDIEHNASNSKYVMEVITSTSQHDTRITLGFDEYRYNKDKGWMNAPKEYTGTKRNGETYTKYKKQITFPVTPEKDLLYWLDYLGNKLDEARVKAIELGLTSQQSNLNQPNSEPSPEVIEHSPQGEPSPIGEDHPFDPADEKVNALQSTLRESDCAF